MIVSLSILNIPKDERFTRITEFMKVPNNWIHFDVMDGNFVANETFKYEVVEEINSYCDFFKDVHLMTYNPNKFLQQYYDAGANQITFHYESVKTSEIEPLIDEIKSFGMKVGMSIKPTTDVSEIEKYLPKLDLILVMSVEPGKGGQKFMDESLSKIKWLNERKRNNNYLISVDGGINNETCKLVKNAGADVIVVGTYLTKDLITKDKIQQLIN